MNIDLLIKMANQIGEFFQGANDPSQVPKDVAVHLTRYWDPRMRAQIIDYCRERHGAGLTDTARAGVEILGQEAARAEAAGAVKS
jgi:formate dehydrogenase subunit delta